MLVVTILLPLGLGHWLKTRKFYPLDAPISLEAGSIHAMQFETNVRGTYHVIFETDSELAIRDLDKCDAAAWRDVHWQVYRLSGRTEEKELWASSSDSAPQGWRITGFHGPSGNYQLEWDVPPEAACLNALGPRVLIAFEPPIDYGGANTFIGYVCLVSGGAGLILLLRGVVALLMVRLVGRPVA
jgi:hypothetical protein